MDELLELAVRCGQATRPDRELDVLIALAAGTQQLAEGYTPEQVFGPGCHAYSGLAYTASLDAAMTLVPEDSGMSFAKSCSGRGGWSVALYDENVIASGATRALALCAAALRARAGKQSADDRG